MEYKYKVIDPKEIKVRLDVVKQELKQWVQLYFDKLEKCSLGEIKRRWNIDGGFGPNQDHK